MMDQFIEKEQFELAIRLANGRPGTQCENVLKNLTTGHQWENPITFFVTMIDRLIEEKEYVKACTLIGELEHNRQIPVVIELGKRYHETNLENLELPQDLKDRLSKIFAVIKKSFLVPS